MSIESSNFENLSIDNIPADLLSRTFLLRVIIVYNFEHFGVSARIRPKINTRKNLYE